MKYAVVTGASSGMGLEFARQLAERKYGIVIVSSRKRIGGLLKCFVGKIMWMFG